MFEQHTTKGGHSYLLVYAGSMPISLAIFDFDGTSVDSFLSFKNAMK